MRAVVVNDWEVRLDDLPIPRPGSGQVLARVLTAGVCRHDHSLVTHGRQHWPALRTAASVARPESTPGLRLDPRLDTMLGHEFSAEVVELGEGVAGLRVGDIVAGQPLVFDGDGAHRLGFSNRYPGAYGEYVVLNELLAIRVPNGVSPRAAALAEPLSVGIHAVNLAERTLGNGAIVLGLDSFGLACVAALRRRGTRPIVGVDESPERRTLAAQLGCDDVVDPTSTSPLEAARRLGLAGPPVVFDAVNAPGSIERAVTTAAYRSLVVVLSGCLTLDTFRPAAASVRELTVRFADVPTPDDYVDAVRAIGDGVADVESWISSTIDLAHLPAILTADAWDPGHTKAVIDLCS